MRINDANLIKRFAGLNVNPFPLRQLLMMGIITRIKTTGRAHNVTNNAMGKSPAMPGLLINSIIINGTTRIRPMMAGVINLAEIFFI